LRQIPDVEPHEAIPDLLHRLRNPLVALKSGVTLVMHVAQPTGEALELLNAMLGEVARIERTANDTQRFFRLVAGHPESVNVAEAARRACALRQAEATEAGVELALEGDDGERVRIHRDHLEFALSELLCNAIRVSSRGGRVRVAWRRHGNGLLAVDVEDSGEGVPSSYAAQVGRPFFSTFPERTGLGLASVSRICRLADGHLSWSNRPRGGARFSLALPVG